jgi:hypothetical protein
LADGSEVRRRVPDAQLTVDRISSRARTARLVEAFSSGRFAEMERLALNGRISVGSMAEFCPAGLPTPGEPSSQATA